MARTVCSTPAAFKAAWSEQYRSVAKRVASLLPGKEGRIVELGGGRGQLSIPLMQLAPSFQVVVVDTYAGRYLRDRQRLLLSAHSLDLEDRITAIRGDALSWLRMQPVGGLDAIVSSEMLPEITSSELSGFFAECHRCLRPGGATVHVFLSPVARNKRQALLIEADSDPRWTSHPPEEWFSPPPRLIVREMKTAGFRIVKMGKIRSGLVARHFAARQILEDFAVQPGFWKAHRDFLTSRGLEIPDWVIASGKKAG